MQSISNTLSTAIKGSAHVVEPSVQVDWVSGKSLANVKGYSSVDDYSTYVRSLNPALYYRLNDNIDYLTAVNTGPKPVSHWRMNNDSGSVAAVAGMYAVQNESGYNNLNLYGTAGSHLLLGQTGNVQDYSGTVSQSTKFISYGGTPGYGLTENNDPDNKWSIADHNNFTVEIWFKPVASTTESVLLYKSNTKYFINQTAGSAQSPEWSLSLESLYPRFVIFNDKNNGYKPLASKSNVYSNVKSSVAVTANTWNHVVVTFDGKVLNMFLNNILVSSDDTMNGVLTNYASGPICVAARYIDYVTPNIPEAGTNFEGWIDEIVIYNETLSAYDIRGRWASGSLNISGRAADTGATIAGTSIYRNIADYSGKGRDGFIITPSGVDSNVMSNGNVVSPFVGRLDGGNLFFANKTCKVDAGYFTSNNTSTGTSVYTGNNLTVSAWVYVTALNGTGSESIEMIAAQGSESVSSAADGAWYLTMRKQASNGVIQITGCVYDSVAGGSSPIVSYASGISINAWHHIVMTVDSSNRLTLMVDGNYTTAESSRTAAILAMNTNPAWKTFIGGRQDSERCRDTYITEVSIINAKTDIRAWSTLYRSVTNINDFKSVNKFYDPLQLVNGQKESTVTWAVLDALDENGNVLTANGDYYLSEHSAALEYTDYEYGWWSKNKSDSSGNFAASAYPSVYLTFDGINCNAIDIYSTNKYGPINDFTMYYEYSTDNGATYQWSAAINKSSPNITSLGNGSYIYSLANMSGSGLTFSTLFGATASEPNTFGEFVNISGVPTYLTVVKVRAIQFFVTSTLYPNDVARIEELSPRWTEDISSYIVSMNINKKRENYDSSVPLGATAANTADIVLDNTDLRFNPQNTSSNLYGLLSPNIKFVTGYNYTTSSGSSPEYIKQGIFYSDTWGIDSSSMTVSTSLRDFSGKMQDSTVTDGYIASNITAGEAIADLAVRSGVPRSKLNIDYNYATQIAFDKPAAFWRFNETQLDQNALSFDGHLYLYSHPFDDLLMGQSGSSVAGLKKDTTYAAKKILPKTFYDFPHSELTLEFWVKCGSSAYSKTIYNYATKRFADEFKVSLDSSGHLVTRVQTYAPNGSEAAGVTSTTVVADNYWHHVAVVLDPAASSSAGNIQVTYYLDGVQDGTGSIASFRPFVPSGQCLIGASFTPSTITQTMFTIDPLVPGTTTTVSASVGAIYKNNGKSFTVAKANTGQSMLICNGVDATFAQYEVLGKISGTGSSLITFYTATNTLSNGPHVINSSSIFNGYLKEFKIWSNASTKPQIVARMNAPTVNKKIGAYSSNVYKNTVMAGSPIAYWPLDMRVNSSNNSTFIRDISGYDRNGTATNVGLTSVSGPIVSEDSSRALKFPVTANTPYVDVSNAIGGSYTFTISSTLSIPGTKYSHNGQVYTVSENMLSYTTLVCYGTGTPLTSGTLTKISGQGADSIAFSSVDYITENIVQNIPFEGDIAGNIAPQTRDFSLFNTSLVNTANVSMEFWIKPTSIPSKGSILSKTSATTANREWVISLNTAGTIQVDVYSTTAVAVSVISDVDKTLSLGSWHHVVCTFSGAKISIYIDGKNAGFGFIPSGIYVSNITSSLRIGLSAAGSDALYDSALAHIAIYRRSLSIWEIYDHYIRSGYQTSASLPEETGKLAFCLPMNQNKFYSFEDLRQSGYAYAYSGQKKENIVLNISKIGNHMYAYTNNTVDNNISSSLWKKVSCLSVKDYALNKNYLNYRVGASPYDETLSNNAITYNNASPISSEIEKSTYFNSTLDQVAYMNYTTDIPMTISSTSSFSIEMWVKPTAFTDERYLLARENFGSTVQGGTWRLSIGTDGKVKFAVYPTTAGSALSITPSPTPSALTANEWAYLAFVFYISGANSVLDIYKNGVIYTTYTWTTSSAALTSAEVKTLIGGYQVSTTNNFDGGISNVAIYNRKLSIDTLALHYVRGKSLYQNLYAGIAASSDSYWGEMLKIATADIGMFYFDENGIFVYEHGRSYDDALDTQHSVVQYTLDDNEDILSASQSVELQVNKISVKVYPKMVSGGATASIWSAPSGTSLAISTLANGISATSTDSISFNTTKNPAGLMEPIWLDSGIVKIDDEFIKYTKTSGNSLFNLTRGHWGSVPSAHLTNAVIGEAREFNMEWSGSPVFYVNYPFMTGVLYDKTIVASNWRFSGQKGYIRLYPSSNAVHAYRYLTIEGNNPITKLDNFFHVSGYVANNDVIGSQIVTEVAEDYKDNIRKYGEKTLEIDNPLIQSESYAKDLAQFLLAKYSVPVPVLEVSTMGIPHLQLGDRIKIDTLDSMSIVAGEYWVMSIDCSYSGGIDQKMSLRRVS